MAEYRLATQPVLSDSIYSTYTGLEWRRYELLVTGACEGTLSCSTCHLIFSQADYDALPDGPTDEEMDMLDLAYGLCDTLVQSMSPLLLCLLSSPSFWCYSGRREIVIGRTGRLILLSIRHYHRMGFGVRPCVTSPSKLPSRSEPNIFGRMI